MPFLIWVEAYYQLTKSEREKIVKFVLREAGLAKLISYIDADNQEEIERENEEVVQRIKKPPRVDIVALTGFSYFMGV